MSLLINALKKYRQEASSSLASEGQKIGENIIRLRSGKAKKIVLISLTTIIVITLTAMASFLIFKHIEKGHIAKLIEGKGGQAQKIKELIAAHQGGKGAAGSEDSEGKSEGKEALRARLQQKMQQANGGAEAPETATTTTATTDTTDTDAAAPAATPAAQPGGGALRAKLAGRTAKGGRSQAEDIQTEASSSSDTADSQASSSTDDNSNASDTSSDTSTSSQTSSVSDVTSSSDTNSDDTNSSPPPKKVDIQVVADQTGSNNPIYQQALGFMQLNQYDKAVTLLADNDELLMQTQGLSALLLGKIYLATSQYDLASEILEHAVVLHVGSDMELLGLRAQTMFMQQRYQDAIDLLSSQSPDLSSFPGYYALLADAYMHLNQASNAVSIFQQIVAQFPDSPDYWLGLAVACQKTGDVSSAMVAYRRAAQLSQGDPQVSLFINQQLQALQAI